MRSIIYYIREFLRPEWLKNFFFAKTAPLVTPRTFYGTYPSPSTGTRGRERVRVRTRGGYGGSFPFSPSGRTW